MTQTVEEKRIKLTESDVKVIRSEDSSALQKAISQLCAPYYNDQVEVQLKSSIGNTEPAIKDMEETATHHRLLRCPSRPYQRQKREYA
ncbi:hypothetical protein BTUL_0092g00170 [Botrytis tulipae]|uniref:Uncharacterized protein n=1 Tax=Botrytis tulipae TaxID=87230 RepID=A0A4Z1ETL5_9HELO|nr:hypothetical protein BTUL_0092g00170 [Botrytis tulipae]